MTEYSAGRVFDVEVEETDALITVGEAASLLHVHTNNVRRWSNLGILPSFRIWPKRWQTIPGKDVMAFLLK